MGTSGAYGGSPGWGSVGNETDQWLDSLGDGSSGDGQDPPEPAPPPGALSGGETPSPPPEISGVLSAIGKRLATGGGGGSGAGGRAGGAGDSGTGGGAARRTTGRAATVGGRALGAVYGARGGVAGPLQELGLVPGDLVGLSRFEQARRILEAAVGPTGDVLESELRETNSLVVLWALGETVEPSPVDLANRWVVEYVWQVWCTETGLSFEDNMSASDRLRAEQEMRAALEASAFVHGLPTGRPLTSADFSAAIEAALSSLRRIGGKP